MVITLTSYPLWLLEKSEQQIVWKTIQKQVEELLALKQSWFIDGWVMRKFWDTTHTTIFYTQISRLLQSKIFWWQRNVSDILEDKRRAFKVTESSEGEEIVVFSDWSVLYNRETIVNKNNTIWWKKFRVTQNELNILKNGDIKGVLGYTRKLWQYNSHTEK